MGTASRISITNIVCLAVIWSCVYQVKNNSKEVVLRTKLLLACGVLIFATYSFARCGQYPIEEHFERSDAVFTVTVENIQDAPEEYTMRRPRTVDGEEVWEAIPQLEIQLNVEDVWKGELDEEVLLYVEDCRSTLPCYSFQIKHRYVVFAHFNVQEHHAEETEKHLRIGRCPGNIGLGKGKKDVDLGELAVNMYHRRHGELETESELVERLGDLRSKLTDSDSSEEAEENTKQ